LGLGLWDWDLGTNTVVWSDETCRQWGFARGTFSGRVEDATVRIHPDDLPKVEHAIQDVLAGKKERYAAQYRIVRPDGTTCWIDAHGVVMPDRWGHMIVRAKRNTCCCSTPQPKRFRESMNEDCTFCNRQLCYSFGEAPA
jgi:PAS domain S-box-containing protein